MPFLDSLNAVRTAALARITPVATAVTSRLGAVIAELQTRMEVLQPALAIGSKVYYYGFIPLVIILGMQSTPRPKLIELLTPM